MDEMSDFEKRGKRLRCLLKAARYAQFLSQGKSYIEEDKDNYSFRLLFARVAALLGKKNLAVSTYAALCEDFPNKQSACVDYGRYAYFILRRKKLAVEFLNLALSRKPSQPSWVNYLAGQKKGYYIRVAENLVYTPIPKNGSTSIKHFISTAIFRLENSETNPHRFFDRAFSQSGITPESNDKKLIVLRDPIERFLSYYNNNIIEFNSLDRASKRQTVIKNSLDLQPSLDAFIDRLYEYCFCFNDVLHHVLPQAAYINDIRDYDFVYDNRSIDDAVGKIAELTGIDDWEAPKKMVTSRPSPISLSAAQLRFLRNFYADDYRLLNKLPEWKFKSYSNNIRPN